MAAELFNNTLAEIKRKVEVQTGYDFNCCLVNLYRDGQDSNGWHADNEKELGDNPVIASVSFGASRFFHLRHNDDKSLKHKLSLDAGSLLLMAGETQHHWKHQIAKTKRTVGERIN